MWTETERPKSANSGVLEGQSPPLRYSQIISTSLSEFSSARRPSFSLLTSRPPATVAQLALGAYLRHHLSHPSLQYTPTSFLAPEASCHDCIAKPLPGCTFFRRDLLRQHMRLVHGSDRVSPFMQEWKLKATKIIGDIASAAEKLKTNIPPYQGSVGYNQHRQSIDDRAALAPQTPMHPVPKSESFGYKLADYHCALCVRQLRSCVGLRKHEYMSEMHLLNLKNTSLVS